MEVKLKEIPEWLRLGFKYKYDKSRNLYVMDSKIKNSTIIDKIYKYSKFEELDISNNDDFIDLFTISYAFGYSFDFKNRPDWKLNYPIFLYDHAYNNLVSSIKCIQKILRNGVAESYVNFFFNSLKYYEPIELFLTYKEENDSYKLKIKSSNRTIGKYKFNFVENLFNELTESIIDNKKFEFTQENSYIIYDNNTINFKTSDFNSSTKFKLHITMYNINSIVDQLIYDILL